MRRTWRLGRLTALAAGLGLAGVLSLGDAPPLEAATCGGPGDPVCTKTESCVWFVIAKICTTKYNYWNTDDGSKEPTADPDSP